VKVDKIKLSPSGADAWTKCTMSPYVEEVNTIKDFGNKNYTIEGTILHKILENFYKNNVPLPKIGDVIDGLELNDEHIESLLICINTVSDYTEDDDVLESEVQGVLDMGSDFDDLLKAPIRGTVDLRVRRPDETIIIDFKFGVGKEVNAEWNLQGICYALMATKDIDDFDNTHEITILIIQPRLYSGSNISSWTVPLKDLRVLGMPLISSKLHEIKHNPQYIIGSHCQFKKCLPICSAFYKQFDDLLDYGGNMAQIIDVLDNEELFSMYKNASLFRKFFDSIEELLIGYIRNNEDKELKLKNGMAIYLTEGRQGKRFFDPLSTDKIKEKLLESGFQEEEILTSPELRTITELEKKYNKKFSKGRFMIDLREYISQSEGGLYIVDTSSKKPNALTNVNNSDTSFIPKDFDADEFL
jgi:hypothetical protein